MALIGEIDAFVAALAADGRSWYTQRSYALGVRHFLRWLADESVELEAVDRQVVAANVSAFRRGEAQPGSVRRP